MIAWILELRERLSIPLTLSGMGLGDIDVAKVAVMGEVDPCAAGNPVNSTETVSKQSSARPFDSHCKHACGIRKRVGFARRR